MDAFLSSLYFNGIPKQYKQYGDTTQASEHLKRANEIAEELHAILCHADYVRFIDYIDARDALLRESGYEAFIGGFRLGASLAQVLR